MKHQRNLILVGIAILLISSCTNQRDTKDNFGKYALSLLNSEKSASNIYIMPNDSLLTSDTILVDWMRSLKDSIKIKEYLEKQQGEIKEWRKKAIDLNLSNANVEFLRTELDTIESFWSKRVDLTVYFLLDKKEHFFVLNDVDSLSGKWTAYAINPPTNMEEQDKLIKEKREKEAKEPYKPYGLYFTSCNWEYQNYRPEIFSNFFVTLKNTTSNDFKKIKFRVTIYKTEKYGKTEVFSKTIVKNENVYSDDVVRFEINELKDFYVGVNITDKDNFDWNAEIIDAKPRPGYEDLPY